MAGRVARVLGHLLAGPADVAATGEHKTAAGKYRFTRNENGVLSDEQQRHYEENGFVVIKSLVPLKDIEKYTQRFLDIANGKAEKAPFMTMMRDVTIAKQKAMGDLAITKLQHWENDPVLFDYCALPSVLRYVTAIVGPNVKSCHTMLINKPPDTGKGSSRHPPHQDLWYFPFRPADKIVCAWTAMQRIDRENGCLFVQPGTHKTQLYKHEYPSDGIVNKAYHGIQNMSSEAHGEMMTLLEMEPGDCVLFHPLLIHGSGRNRSTRTRKAISCHYASTECEYIEVIGTMQEDIAKEVEGMMGNRGLEVPYQELWKYKSRLVAGKEGSF